MYCQATVVKKIEQRKQQKPEKRKQKEFVSLLLKKEEKIRKIEQDVKFR